MRGLRFRVFGVWGLEATYGFRGLGFGLDQLWGLGFRFGFPGMSALAKPGMSLVYEVQCRRARKLL